MGPAQGPPQSPHLTASAQTRAPLPLPPPLAPAVMASAGAGVKGDMGLITAWLGVRGGSFYLFESWFPLLQNGRRTGDMFFVCCGGG